MTHPVKKIFSILFTSILPFVAVAQPYTSTQSDSWVGVDGLERTIDPSQYPDRQPKKFVAMFYFLWHGAHGYDRHAGDMPDEGIFTPTPEDKNSPYDISKMLRESPNNPAYGPIHAFHHWAEPLLGYYVSNDEWVIEKHVQMLADAGVDVLVCDNTNARVYLPQVLTLCKVMERMRRQGRTTPQISFMINADPAATLQKLYNGFFGKGLYQDLWFYWEGKPLVLCPFDNLSTEMKSFFTLRHSWFNSRDAWFGNGQHKWPWADYYPQGYGWHSDPQQPEALSVAVATHPIAYIGRSFHNGKQPDTPHSATGEFFAEQWQRALEVDPSLVFITGWNEWSAMRMTDGAAATMLNKQIQKGDSYFVDQYNEEFSRDIEPMRGAFGDSYYYQLAHYIRLYKGVTHQQPEKKLHNLKIDANFEEWEGVDAVYTDDRGDTTPRNHFGYGRMGQLTNYTGRNDIVLAKVATDGKQLFFYVETAAPITPHTDTDWLRLYIGCNPEANKSNWEGFGFRVNGTVHSARTTSLEEWSDKKAWIPSRKLAYRTKVNQVELAVPLEKLGIKNTQEFSVTFKWCDNVPDNDIVNCIDHGDAAPNGRFGYRFEFKQNKP